MPLLSRLLKAEESAGPSWWGAGFPPMKGTVPDPPGRGGSEPAMRNGESTEFLMVAGVDNDALRERGVSPLAPPGVAGLTPVGGWCP